MVNYAVYWYNAGLLRGPALSMHIVNFPSRHAFYANIFASVFFLKGNPMPQGPENLLLKDGKLCIILVQCGSPKGTGIVNAYCQFSQQGRNNFMQTYLH